MKSACTAVRKGIAAIAILATALLTASAAIVGSASVASASVPTAGGTYQLVAGHSGMCLDLPGASGDNGVGLQQWGCTDGAAWQQFRLTSVSQDRYQLVSVSSGKCLDVEGGSTATGARVLQWDCGSSKAWQQWTVVAGSGGAHRVANVQSGLCLTVQNASTASGAAIVQGACTTATDKQWTFDDGATAPGSYTVAADGTGQYRTVQAAVDAVGAGNASRVTITIKPGTYRERVIVPTDKPYVSLVGGGDSSDDVVIVNNISAGMAGSHRGSATLVAEGHDFVADNLTVSNDFDEASQPSGGQALAVYLNADRAVLDDLRLLGDQDTFLVNNNARAYVTDSYIEGTVDFIYGGGIAVFERCKIYEKRSTGGPITAASTPAERQYGFLFYRSTITGATNGTTQLGRPWRQGAQVVYRESSLSATIATGQPWIDMSDAEWENARYFEYRNTGAGATVNSNRPQLTDAQALDYTPRRYLAGSDGWNPVGSPWSATPDGFAATGGGTNGGSGGQTVTVTTYADLERYATASGPYVIRVAAPITATQYGRELPVASDKTIVGVGTQGQIVNGGFFLGEGVHDVIIRNLWIRDTRMADDDPDDKVYDYDGIQMDTADHIWIDHNRISRMNDGLIDSRKDTTYLTVSWNILEEGNKSFGIGWTTNVTSRMTIHHNWIRATNQRNPSIDNVAFAHLYNNYLQDITSYGNLSRGAARTVIENSYYERVNNPFYRDTTAASLTQTGSVLVDATGRAETGGTTFTPADHYSYRLDPAADVPAIVRTGAGPQPTIG
jgi:pectin methylesterase-like acyl-CoA thioesterase